MRRHRTSWGWAAARVALGALALVVGLGALGTAPAAAAEPEVRTYTVQPGDSVWSIAEEFYGSGKKYTIIYKYNRFIGRPPFLLKPGQVLRLPVGGVLPEAQVTWTKRDVKAKPPRSLDWLTARERMNLWKLYRVSTGDESAVHILFEDESDLRLRDNALLVIYGGTARSARAQQVEKRRVKLEQGTLRGGLARLDGASADATPEEDAAAEPSLEIETPSGQIDLFGALAQVQADAGASMVSVYEGRASVKAAGAEVKVAAGQGTVVKKGKRPEPARPLPATPRWAGAGAGDAVALVPTGGKGSLRAAWEPVAEAATYRIELANDAEFKQTFIDVELAASAQQAFLLADLDPGRYFARVAARDASGLEGEASAPLLVDVVAVTSSRLLTPAEDGSFECVAFTRLELPADVGAELTWRVGDGPPQPGTEPLRLAEAGVAEIRVRRKGATLDTPFTVRVLGVTGAIGDPDAPLAIAAPDRWLPVTVVDERGRPAALPGLVLEASPIGAGPDGGDLALEAAPSGDDDGAGLRARVPAPEGAVTEVAVRLSWAGGVLATRTFEVDRSAAEVPYDYPWGDATLGLGWDRREQATTLPSVAPIDRVGVHGWVRDADRPGAADAPAERVLGVDVVGEWALADARLGLDAALTILRPELGREPTSGSSLGDLVVGGRYLLFGGGGAVEVAPSLRLRAPLVARGGERLWGFEPGVLARFGLADGLWLDTRQAVVLASDFADLTHLSYAGALALLFRPVDLLSVNAQLDAAVSISRPDGAPSYAAFAAGLGVYLHIARVRVGLGAGFGLNADGRDHLGRVTGQLTVDLGFGDP